MEILHFRFIKIWILAILVIQVNATNSTKKRVCVIGAGAAGLASVKQLASNLDDFEPVVFERNSDVGGLWIYTNNSEFDKHGLPVHSSIYKNLRTNVPKELMAFPDYRSFYGEERSCVRHETVLQYLRNFTDHFDLRRFIQFDTIVKLVSPILTLNGRQTAKWRMKTSNTNTGTTNETICDAVMICNGHFFEPLIPKIPGIDTFTGRIIHSHEYRHPEEFSMKTVALLGASFSGVDIANDLSGYARKIYISHRHGRMKSELPPNVEQVRAIVAASGDTLLLRDNTTITVDAFIYCTGYKYSMPFLDASSKVRIDDKRLFPLYKHVVNMWYPTMGFIGVPDTTVFFPSFNVQARYFIALLQGKADLISDTQGNIYRNARKPHLLRGDEQWTYLTNLAVDGRFEPLPDFYENGYKYWISRVSGKQLTFRDYDLRISEDGRLDLVGPEDKPSNRQ